jgi:hypothetical protein
MPLFRLHVRRGNTVYEDREGTDLPSLDDAVQQAVNLAREIMRDEPELPPADQWVEVVDEAGKAIRTVPFVIVGEGPPGSVLPVDHRLPRLF